MSDKDKEKIASGEAIAVTKKQLFISFLVFVTILIGFLLQGNTWKNTVDNTLSIQGNRLTKNETNIKSLQDNGVTTKEILQEIKINQKTLMKKLGVDYVEGK